MKTFEKIWIFKCIGLTDLINELLLDLINVLIYFKKQDWLTCLFLPSVWTFCYYIILQKVTSYKLNKRMSFWKYWYDLTFINGYLALGVAPPGVNVSAGGEHQRVLSSDGHILDVDPRQRWDLLGTVVVPSSAFRQTDETIWKKEKKRKNNHKKLFSPVHTLSDILQTVAALTISVPNLVRKWRLCRLWSEPQRTVSHRPLS